jgi:hypothetical protein
MRTPQRRMRPLRDIASIMGLGLLGAVLAITATCARAFSLLGPYASWMDEVRSFRQPDRDIGGPMNFDEGYRWNVPVVTYGFDASFLEYFGSNGVAEVERAIDVFNSLPPASQLDPASYPTRVIRVNSQAASQGLIDLKSVTMFLLIEHLGLAEPQRFTFCLRNSVQTADGFQDAVIQRNFDPITLHPSSNLNDTAFVYSVWHSEDSSRADAIESAADPSQPANSAVADGIAAPGQFFIGLSRDDVGGLRYLLSTNAVNYESLLPGVRGEGINASSWVEGAARPGVDKITFVRQPFDALLARFLPMTNQFVDNYITNGAVQPQHLERVVSQPDFLFTAADLQTGLPTVVRFARTGTSNWVNNAVLNGRPSAGGPGNIQPPVTITFDKLGTAWATAAPGADDHPGDQTVRWGTFDGTANVPVAYPFPPEGTVRSTARLWLVFGSPTNQSSHSFQWPISGTANAPFVLQTSTDLITWKSLATNAIDGSVFTYFQWFPTSQQRFYKIVSD